MKINIQPYPSQIEGAKFLVSRTKGLLNYATGTGKTLISLLTGFKLISLCAIDKFLLVGTKSSVIEIKNDFNEKTEGEELRDVSDVSALIDFLRDSEGRFGVVQYNTIKKIFSKNSDGSLNTGHLDFLKSITKDRNIGVMFDEVHTLKNPNAHVTRSWKTFRQLCSHSYGMTATSLTKDIYDLYHLVGFFDLGILGSLESFNNHFVNRKLEKIRQGKRIRHVWKVLSYKNLDRLGQLLENFKLDYFPSQKVQFKAYPGELSNVEEYHDAALGFFKSEKRKKEREKKGQEEPDVNAHSVRLIDLQTVVNSDPNKQQLLVQCVEQKIDQGTLIFCSYYESVDVVVDVLENYGWDHRQINGKMSSAQRKENKDWFCESPSGKVLIITVAGGQSLNLQATPNIIFWDLPFSVGHFIQILGRVVRQFSTFDEFYINFIIMKDTVDEYKYEFLTSKKELVEQLTSNKSVPPGSMDGYNAQVLKRLRRRFLWKKAEIS